jgi:hypothetical protein
LTTTKEYPHVQAFEAKNKKRAESDAKRAAREAARALPDYGKSLERYELEVQYGQTIQVIRDARTRYSFSRADLAEYKADTRKAARSEAVLNRLQNAAHADKKELTALKAPAAARRKELAHELGGMYPFLLPLDNFLVKVPSILVL